MKADKRYLRILKERKKRKKIQNMNNWVNSEHFLRQGKKNEEDKST